MKVPAPKKQRLEVTCDTKLRVPYRELNGIQGALKMLSKEKYEKARRLIIDDGINFALHVWKENTKVKGKNVAKWWIIDGHARHAIIRKLIEEEDFQCGDLPCVEIQAKSFKDAKRKVLAASSHFHETTKEGLYEFMTDLGIGLAELEAYELSDIDIPDFKMEYYDEETVPAVEGEKKNVSFDAYQNAAIKQVVLYYASEEYKQVLAALDLVMEELALEDYSQVVWRLLSERNKSKP